MVRTCQQLLKVTVELLTFLEIEGIDPTINAAERALWMPSLLPDP